MTKLDNFEFEVMICDAPHPGDRDGNCTRQVDVCINVESDADAVMILSDIVKSLYATNELLNKKGGPKVL